MGVVWGGLWELCGEDCGSCVGCIVGVVGCIASAQVQYGSHNIDAVVCPSPPPLCASCGLCSLP